MRARIDMCKQTYRRESLSYDRFLGAGGGDSPADVEHGPLSVALRHLSCGRISLVFGRDIYFARGPRRFVAAARSIDRGLSSFLLLLPVCIERSVFAIPSRW